MSRIALIEDHDRLASVVSEALLSAGIETDRFPNISKARYALDRAEYAVLIIDRGLPDGDGLTFLRALRSAGRMTPCMMLTARDALHDRVEGLEAGADDYVTKPFAMSELVARVRTLMRRPPILTELVASFADLSIDPEQGMLSCRSNSIFLAPAELQIVQSLIHAAGRTVRHATLERAAWGLSDTVTRNALEVTLHRIRKKLNALETKTRVVNVRGMGFSLSADL